MENILWPDDFTDAEQKTLREFVGDQVKAIGIKLDTQERRLAAIWEIRYVLLFSHGPEADLSLH
jgi:hypothetical protein